MVRFWKTRGILLRDLNIAVFYIRERLILIDRALQMQFMLLFSRQGKLRLQKWYVAHPDKLKKKITRELITTILARKPKMSSFLEWKDVKVVYKRSGWFQSNLMLKIPVFFCIYQLYISVQIREPLFLLCHWTEWQWVTHPGDNSQIRWATWQILWQRKSNNIN